MRNLERSQTKMAIYQRERNRKIKSGEWAVKARGPRGKGVTTPEPQSSPVEAPGASCRQIAITRNVENETEN